MTTAENNLSSLEDDYLKNIGFKKGHLKRFRKEVPQQEEVDYKSNISYAEEEGEPFYKNQNFFLYVNLEKLNHIKKEVLELVEKTEDENYEGLSLPDGTPTAMTITYDRDDYVVRFKEHYKPDKRISTKKFRSHIDEVSYSKIYQDLDNFMDKFVEEKQYQDLLDKLAAALSHGDLGAIKQCRENELDVSKPFFTFYGYADQEYEMLVRPYPLSECHMLFQDLHYIQIREIS
jgi:hypothetical protein